MYFPIFEFTGSSYVTYIAPQLENIFPFCDLSKCGLTGVFLYFGTAPVSENPPKKIPLKENLSKTYFSENKKTHIIIAAPKSSSANRVIPIPNTLLKILSQYPMEKTGYFLSGSLSEVVEPRRIQYRFHKILKECGIDRKNFHVLRHTFATRCVEANIDIKTLSEILGHSSVSITMNRYVHPSLSLKRDSMEKLADFIAVK